MTLSRPAHSGLRHVALNVIDLEACEKFYVDLLGFSVEWKPDADNLYLCSGIDNLALHRVIGNSSKNQRLDHIGIIIDTIPLVDEWYAFLLENKVKIINQPKTHRDGAHSFYCYDPEGTAIQIIYHPPISRG